MHEFVSAKLGLMPKTLVNWDAMHRAGCSDFHTLKDDEFATTAKTIVQDVQNKFRTGQGFSLLSEESDLEAQYCSKPHVLQTMQEE